MKIVFLSTWADGVGGTEHMIFRQANWLARKHEVEVLGVFKSRKDKELAFHLDERVRLTFLVDATEDVHRPIRGDLDDTSCRALMSQASKLVEPSWEGAFNAMTDIELELALRQRDVDIVVSTTPALLALASVLSPTAILVHQEHRVSELRGSSGIPLRTFAPRADALVLLSTPTKMWFSQQLGAAAPKLVVIPNSIEEGFQPRSTRQTKTIVWAGRLVAEKQPLAAIRAFAQVAVDHPEWTLRMFGDGPLRPACEREISALGLGLQAHLMGVSKDMRSEWPRASIALMTSRVEAFGVVLLEAATAAVPLVSFNCPNGPSEIVEDGRTGLLVSPDDIDGLSSALRKLVENDDIRHRMGDSAAASMHRFELKAVMSQWEELYAALLMDRSRSEWAERKMRRVTAALVKGAERTHRFPEMRSEAPASGADDMILAGAIEAKRADIVWSSGQISTIRDDLSASDVAERNLAIAAQAMQRANINYILIPSRTVAHRLALRKEHSERAISALRSVGGDEPIYVDLLDQRGRAVVTSLAVSITADVLANPMVNALRIYAPVVTSGRTFRYGSVYGCTVDFLTALPDAQQLLPSQVTPIGEAIPIEAMTPATVTVGERSYPTIDAFVKTLPDDITFPIDIVYTWVDSCDPAWQAKRLKHCPDSMDGSSGMARYRNRDELKYSLRSIDMFASWINHVWLVTDGQCPDWLDAEHPRISLVDHRDVFGASDALPTFNSHAIESQLHRIDGLAEHFIYFNDDVFLGRPVLPRLFFRSSGLPLTFRSPTQIPITPAGPTDDYNVSAAKNNRLLLERRFGRTLTHGFLHAPHPHTRSLLWEISNEFSQDVRRTMYSKVRSHEDVSLLSSLAQHYGLFAGKAIPGQLKCGFVNVGLRDHHQRLDRMLAGRGYDVFCINDFHDGDVTAEEQTSIITAFLAAYFPVASVFERGSIRNIRSRQAGSSHRQAGLKAVGSSSRRDARAM